MIQLMICQTQAGAESEVHAHEYATAAIDDSSLAVMKNTALMTRVTEDDGR